VQGCGAQVRKSACLLLHAWFCAVALPPLSASLHVEPLGHRTWGDKRGQAGSSKPLLHIYVVFMTLGMPMGGPQAGLGWGCAQPRAVLSSAPPSLTHGSAATGDFRERLKLIFD
jgi:hypothetical protein